MATAYANDVTSTLNFAADRNDGGRHDNRNEENTRLNLVTKSVTISDARLVTPAPAFDREGFALVEHHLDDPKWFDEAWIDSVYAPSCEELVKRVTGAREAVSFFRPLKRIADPDARKGHMSTAGFVHVDHPRAVGENISKMFAAQRGTDFTRAKLFNVWKAFTPPPQDRPLTVADRRTIPADAQVVGVTVEDGQETPYIIMAPDEGMRFYYYSNMTIDESLVFTNIDFDPQNPLGCAHSAFDHPDGGVSRSSVEARIIAIFD